MVATREAFTRNTRTHHLGEAVIISADDVHAAFDLFLERWRARFATEESDAQARVLPIETVLLAIFTHVHRIGRRGDEHGSLVIVDHHEVTFGIARTSRDDHATQMLQDHSATRSHR